MINPLSYKSSRHTPTNRSGATVSVIASSITILIEINAADHSIAQPAEILAIIQPLAVDAKEQPMYKHILLPTDHSELADKSITQGLTLAKMLGAKVTILTIFEPLRGIVAEGVIIPIPEEAHQAVANKIAFDLKKVAARASAQSIPCEISQVEADQPWRAIVDEAQKRNCDLIVMASHGRRGVSALILGSETQKVLTHSKIPVLVYR
jgi:nucleotide-binding universal stress UspA family protein